MVNKTIESTCSVFKMTIITHALMIDAIWTGSESKELIQVVTRVTRANTRAVGTTKLRPKMVQMSMVLLPKTRLPASQKLSSS